MASMKKHPSLEIDYRSTVKFSSQEKKKLELWLKYSSRVVEKLLSEKIIPLKGINLSTVRVSLLICGDSRMRGLNREYRGKDKVTDVLSFPSAEGLRAGSIKNYVVGGEMFLGDLAICNEQTKRQAKRFSISYWDEFIHLYFHGILHLLGFDHELSSKEEKLMQKWEERALKIFSETKKKGA